MTKLKMGIFAILAILLISLSAVVVSAQYITTKTTDVTINSDGTFVGTQSETGVSFEIQGTAGATGSVTASVYNGNPQPGAIVPTGISLTHFIAITFDINANNFSQAKIVITYTDDEVQGINSDYIVYKYIAGSNSYVALPTAVDTTAKTLTVVLTSVNDPELAIGGTTASSSGGQFPVYAWVIIAVAVIVIIVIVVFLMSWLRRRKR